MTTISDEPDDIYHGETNKDGQKHGYGSFQWASGSRYEGEWQSDVRHGSGRMEWADGDTYDGSWIDGKMSGEGTYIWQNGNQYSGQWFGNKRHGPGTFTRPDGSIYRGDWVDDRRSGFGTYVFPEGEKYEGNWVDGRMHGLGLYSYSDGKTFQGYWFMNLLHGRGTETYQDGRQFLVEFVEAKEVSREEIESISVDIIRRVEADPVLKKLEFVFDVVDNPRLGYWDTERATIFLKASSVIELVIAKDEDCLVDESPSPDDVLPEVVQNFLDTVGSHDRVTKGQFLDYAIREYGGSDAAVSGSSRLTKRVSLLLKFLTLQGAYIGMAADIFDLLEEGGVWRASQVSRFFEKLNKPDLKDQITTFLDEVGSDECITRRQWMVYNYERTWYDPNEVGSAIPAYESVLDLLNAEMDARERDEIEKAEVAESEVITSLVSSSPSMLASELLVDGAQGAVDISQSQNQEGVVDSDIVL